jgi:hypothetical protein
MRSGMILFGTIVTIIMVMAALWAWQNADGLVEEWAQPALAMYAVRCAAVALVAGAQIVLLACVIGRIYKSSRADGLWGVVAAGVCAVSIVSAVTLALVGR